MYDFSFLCVDGKNVTSLFFAFPKKYEAPRRSPRAEAAAGPSPSPPRRPQARPPRAPRRPPVLKQNTRVWHGAVETRATISRELQTQRRNSRRSSNAPDILAEYRRKRLETLERGLDSSHRNANIIVSPLLVATRESKRPLSQASTTRSKRKERFPEGAGPPHELDGSREREADGLLVRGGDRRCARGLAPNSQLSIRVSRTRLGTTVRFK